MRWPATGPTTHPARRAAADRHQQAQASLRLLQRDQRGLLRQQVSLGVEGHRSALATRRLRRLTMNGRLAATAMMTVELSLGMVLQAAAVLGYLPLCLL